MEWHNLLSADRLGAKKAGAPDPARPPYTIDSDRIIFCSAFRRLQDKTQVFPLADNDFVRTRLTHSLEVASVGRSLGARWERKSCAGMGLGRAITRAISARLSPRRRWRTIWAIRRSGIPGRTRSSTGFRTRQSLRKIKGELTGTAAGRCGKVRGQCAGLPRDRAASDAG